MKHIADLKTEIAALKHNNSSLEERIVKLEHMHFKENSFKCDICQFEAQSITLLTYHIISEHRQEDLRYSSHEVNPETQTDCESAKDSVTLNESQYLCYLCGKVFKSIKTINNHVQKYHIKEMLHFQCHLCEKYFEEYFNLAYHMKVEHETCPNCGDSLLSYGSYKDHHLKQCGPRPHPCDICLGRGIYPVCLECGAQGP